MQKEPSVIIGSVVAVVIAVIDGAILFGLDFTAEQSAALVVIVNAVAVLVGAIVTRGQVYAPDTVDKIVYEAKERKPIVKN